MMRSQNLRGSTRVVIYTRLSRDRDGTSTATARQAEDCRAHAAREGWEVVGVYEDSDYSGFKKGVRRPDYERMLVRVDEGDIDAVLVWKLDRLTRQPGQFEAVVQALERNRARIVSMHEPADMTSPAGLAMLRVGMAFASLESETNRLRTRRAKAEQADAGRPNGGGLRPFGLTADKAELVPGEAALVREAADRVISGESLLGIVRDWDARGVLTTRGNRWRVTSLRKMLLSPRLTGARVHGARVIASDVIPAILDDATHRQVVALVTDRPDTRLRVIRCLSGLVRCGRCGGRMQPKRRPGGTPLYRCQREPGTDQCGGMVVVAEPVEDIVAHAIRDAVAVDEVIAATHGASAARLVAEITDARQRLARLTDDHYTHGLVDREDFLRSHGHLRGLLARLELDLTRVTRRDVVGLLGAGETIREAWATRGDVWRNRLARTLIDRVVIHPAVRRGSNRFDGSRVEVVWLPQEGGDPGDGGGG